MLIAIQTTMEKVAVAFLFQPLPCGDLFKYQYCKSVLPVVKKAHNWKYCVLLKRPGLPENYLGNFAF